MSLRAIQNGMIELRDVFVPEKDHLVKARDFASGTNKILKDSRLMVAWGLCGVATGAYEAALKYTLERK